MLRDETNTAGRETKKNQDLFKISTCMLLITKRSLRPSFQRIVETVVLHWWDSYTVNTKIWFYQLICYGRLVVVGRSRS